VPKFAKGHPKLGGRAPGTPNHNTAEVRALARSLVGDPEYVEQFKERLLSGTLAPVLERMIWEYSFGKPPQVVDLELSESAPLQLDTVRQIYAEVAASRKKNAATKKNGD
jgi:hypothetical protein